MAERHDLSDPSTNRHQSDFVLRFRKALKNGGGYNAVLEKSGISNGSLNRYLKGNDMKVGTAFHLAAVCGVTPQWLLFGEDAGAHFDPTTTQMSSLKVQVIRSYSESGASAVLKSPISDQSLCEKFAIPTEILEDLQIAAKDALMIRVAGDSMSPTLMPHDRVIIDTRRADYLSGIYLFTSDGHALVKRLAIAPGGYVNIISDNERYPPSKAHESQIRWQTHNDSKDKEGIVIIGRVVYKMQKMS